MAKQTEKKIEFNLVIDFDSTIVKVETLDIIAQLSSNNNIIQKIKNITNDAMEGRIGFQEALNKRIQILSISKNDIDLSTKLINKSITNSFLKNKRFLKENCDNCYIVSGGFKEIIDPIATNLGFKKNNIFANTFNFKNNIVDSIDKNNFLSNNKGKVEILKNYININKKDSIIIGDGYTDYEIKKYNEAKYFVQFIENINRESLNSKADLIASNFNEIIEFVKLKNE